MSLRARSAAGTTAARYETLIRVSEALGACHEREVLFRSLARELRRVVAFNFLGLALYDENTHTFEPCVLEATGKPVPPPQISTEDSFTYWVVRHQQPLLISLVDNETRFPQAIAYIQSQGMRSICALPLTTPQRRVGMLLAGSCEPHAYDAEDVTFLSLVSNQVALAIDDALNFSALQQALVIERDRARNLAASDDLLRAMSAVLDIRDVFPRVSQIAASVLPHDRLTLTSHDGDGVEVVQAVSHPEEVFATRLKLGDAGRVADATCAIIEDFATEVLPIAEPPDFWQRIRAAGYRSLLEVRFRAHEQQLGLQFWAKSVRAFDAGQVPIARRIADHVRLSISHQQLADIARQAAEARLQAKRLEARVKLLSDELAAKTGVRRTVGSSPAWRAVLKAATQVAVTDTTVLLVGESGTGKEVVARFIHQASIRQGGPFVALNCAALPEQLLESELFGYERGAFTGAQQAKPGQIELAAGGVLFLDEVSEMSPSAQAKFLRVLQEREFQRLGATRALKADVRVIAATNRDLKQAMDRGEFRVDLFYRLQVFDISLPPLRARSGDIVSLGESFLDEIGQLFGRPPAGLTHEARNALLQYHWPGNVRELRNVLERAAILCEGGPITAEHLSLDRDRSTSVSQVAAPLPQAAAPPPTDLSVVEREMIVRVLAECRGNKSRAAARLGISRTQLYVRLRRYQLS